MESSRIEILLEKYFQGESSIAEENELRKYFSSSDVAQHLLQYQPLFAYFSQEKEQKFTPEFPSQSRKKYWGWLSVAASAVVLLGIGTYVYHDVTAAKQELGTYDDPQVAFRQTQKALALLSNHVNTGIESVQYVQEYQNSKELVFKQ
ncbi:hypothetical protein [Flavobacterium acetivorans]|uniref:hypothetical protein n=1 Tax=Flavobacterium acetivorans TaxID=2893883 RepID=UPI001E4C27A9|nr:hypothetical protein [Flavobacterium sp. F-29]UFH35518.1 hypothetical protein LNP19_00335 [Flavobacterium sp. F-29]